MTIEWSDFEKVEMRVGKIISVEDFPEARKPAYKLKIDFGALGIKNSSAQITTLYSKKDLLGKLVIAVVNFNSKKIGSFMSECLTMGIYADKGVVLLQPEQAVELGSKIG